MFQLKKNNLRLQSFLPSTVPARQVIPAPRHNFGFTLIEVLISMMVLSSLIYIATLSYSMFLDVWQKKKLIDTTALNDYRSHILVRSALESVCDYYVTDPSNEKIGHYYPFFKGKKKMLEFVTLSSVFNKGIPAAARLSLKDSPNGHNLIYEELPLDQTYIKYADVNPKYSRAMVVYTGIKKMNFSYYGMWEIKWSQKENHFKTIYKWQDTFSGQEKNNIPEMIKITLVSEAVETVILFPVRAKNVYKRSFFEPVFK